MEILTIFLVGISLSMDTFSLSIGYGTLNLSNKKILLLSIIVGVYHFLMPQFGMLVGHIISRYIVMNIEYLVSIIFFFLGITMIFSIKKEEKEIIALTLLGMLLFGLSVSIDSFSAGIGMEFISNKHFLCSVIFLFTSAIFTYVGLKIGKKINNIFKNVAPIMGGIFLILFAIFSLIKY